MIFLFLILKSNNLCCLSKGIILSKIFRYAMKLFLYRLSLQERNPSLRILEASEAELNESRQDFLMRILNNGKMNYTPRANVNLQYVPVESEQGVLHSVIAKRKQETGRYSNENPLELGEREKWEICNVIFNFENDEQVAGVEYNQGIAQDPKTIINGLVKHLNNLDTYLKYHIEVYPVKEHHSFWDAVESCGEKITTFTFEIVPSNPVPDNKRATDHAFDLLDALDAQKLKQTANNPEGLNLENSAVKDMVAKSERGEASVTARSPKGSVYNSDNNVKIVNVEDDIYSKTTHKFKDLYRKFSGILKR
jgi:hypothetical protein